MFPSYNHFKIVNTVPNIVPLEFSCCSVEPATEVNSVVKIVNTISQYTILYTDKSQCNINCELNNNIERSNLYACMFVSAHPLTSSVAQLYRDMPSDDCLPHFFLQKWCNLVNFIVERIYLFNLISFNLPQF